MDLKLNDKTAFISGATSGIGYATAKALLKEGMTVYINGRSKKSLEKAIDNLQNEVANAKINGIVANFFKEEEVENIFSKLEKVDVLINNVGIYSTIPFSDTSATVWKNQFQVNVMSGVALSNHFLKGMLNQNWGRIVFISSECAYLVPPDMISYSATKAALHAVSRGLAQITRGTEVTSNVVVPGSTLSEGAKKFITQKAKVEKSTPQIVETNFFKNERPSSLIERFATTDEVASTIAYLCSPNSSVTNGSVIKVDGGSSGGIL